VLVAVNRPILGVDFLARHKLMVDAAACCMLLGVSLRLLAPPAIPSRRTAILSAVSTFSKEVRSLLAAFPNVISNSTTRPQPCHGVEHVVETMGQPVFAKAQRLDPDKLRTAEAKFKSLEAAGIVCRSDSPWSLPLHIVPKKDGSWRPCGDYRQLNLATKPDRYPLPSLADLSNKLHGCKYLIDLVKGYHG
jgi:hypothetical protein